MSAIATAQERAVRSRMNGVRYALHLADCIQWMEQCSPQSVHAIVTDPPYGLKEYTLPEKEKLRRGRGGIWRIPPSFDGCVRSSLPRFTVLSDEDRSNLRQFFLAGGPTLRFGQRWAHRVQKSSPLLGFDLAGTIYTRGAPSFAVFAKGGRQYS